jgi:hypothetical protein
VSGHRASRLIGIAGLVVAGVVLLVSLVPGAPNRLPGVALGWPALLYIERAALIAVVVIGIGGTADRMLAATRSKASPRPGVRGCKVAQQAADVGEALRDTVDFGLRELDERITPWRRPLTNRRSHRGCDCRFGPEGVIWRSPQPG